MSFFTNSEWGERDEKCDFNKYYCGAGNVDGVLISFGGGFLCQD